MESTYIGMLPPTSPRRGATAPMPLLYARGQYDLSERAITRQHPFRIPSPRQFTVRLAVEQLTVPNLQPLTGSPRRPQRIPALPGKDIRWLPKSPRGRMLPGTLVPEGMMATEAPRLPPVPLPTVPMLPAMATKTAKSAKAADAQRQMNPTPSLAMTPRVGLLATSESEHARDVLPTYKLLDDMNWILFPQTDVYQPRELASSLSPAQHADMIDVLMRVHLLRHISELQARCRPAVNSPCLALSDARLFGPTSAPQLSDLINSIGRIKIYPRYARLVHEGTVGSSCFIILSGQVVTVSTKVPGTNVLGPGSTFGEGGLVTDVVRDASVGALTNCRVLLLERSALEHDAEHHPGRQRFATALQATPEWTELRHSVIVGMLDAIPFFSALVASRRAVLATLMEVVSFGVGETIFSEGTWVSR